MSPRADAVRSRAAIADAAVRLLNERSDTSIETIAAAAGVTRQTVYAHYPSREDLLAAAVDRVTGEAVAAMDDADLDAGPATAALLRVLDISGAITRRYGGLLRQADPNTDHEPVAKRLGAVIRRGQAAGEFDPRQDPDWLLNGVIALGHAAAPDVPAAALRLGVLRFLGAPG